ncbi:unnamed protein product, partial [Phaeothamnion confervicola]
ERKDAEGSLLVVRRSTAPEHQMVVMNRLSYQNLTQPVTAALRVAINEPYLMFQSTDPVYVVTHGKTHGIWFHSDAERVAIAQCLDVLVKQHKAKAAAAAAAATAAAAAATATAGMATASAATATAAATAATAAAAGAGEAPPWQKQLVQQPPPPQQQ